MINPSSANANAPAITDELFESVWPFCGVEAYRVNSLIDFFVGVCVFEESNGKFGNLKND